MRKISLFLLVLTFFSCTKDQQFKVTVNINPTQGGSVAPPSGDYDDGDTVNFIATANSGYEFLNWSGDLSGSNNPAAIKVDADKSITAIFGLLDSEAPSLVVSPSTQTIEVGGAFTLPQVSASDSIDGDLNSSVTVSGEDAVDTALAGSYEITYTITDAAGNTTTAVHTVVVQNGVDTQAPVIHVDPTLQNIIAGVDQYSPPTVTATDNIDEINNVNDIVGNLSTTDVDVLTDSFIYTISGTDAISFNINGNQLRASERFDYEAKTS